jgi:glycosyltransferase involved in cell wall biosynthesis
VPVRAVYNAIDLDRFSPGPGDGPALDAACGLSAAPPGTVRVGLVATFARWKGQDLFLEAASRLAPDLPCRFYIVGGPIYRSAGSQWSPEELNARAAALGLTDRVGFAGFWPEPAAALRALDIVVHASTRPEPFGRVVVEAMACGRAVVAVRDGGSAELFTDGVSALGVPRDDPAALADALARLVGDADLRQRLGEVGRAEAVSRFDRHRLAGEWEAVYRRVLGRTTSDE